MRRVQAVFILALTFGFALAMHAQRGGGAGGGAPAKPLVPAAASSLATNPEAFLGQYVTVMAAVEQRYSPWAFTIDQDKTKSTGQEVLVFAATLNAPVDLNTYVTVIGDCVRFDPAEIAKRGKDLMANLPPDVAAKFQGKAVIVATSVINASLVDLMKRMPAPMTAEEEAFSKQMKKIQPAFTALRTAVAASKADESKENAGILKAAFAETEAFWKSKGKTDALGWAQDARKQAETIEKAAAAGTWEEAKTAAATLGTACQTCHGTYRERFDDGSYRFKGGH
jgi:cytochrome c556